MRYLCAGILLFVISSVLIALEMDVEEERWRKLTPAQRIADVEQRRGNEVRSSLTTAGFKLGDLTYLRAIKEASVLEVWMQKRGEVRYSLYKAYPVARWSGTLGPKQKEGDLQAPEGCYAITRGLMHPASSYHLAMNIGYPNELDRSLGRTGNLIMIHGKNVSLGCFAMTDPAIEEIYMIVDAALKNGQSSIPVHSFPFRMDEARIASATADEMKWQMFWRDLLVLWDHFEKTGQPPTCRVVDNRYVLGR
ncbi:MAG: 2-dehydro-3-deoxyphosphooctonate aldolase [Verrucomicrobiaceae bacterium]|nr:2-dehydro-3-deoxyphosphooctonate aldolase [Verrucomicrobiaceae bacterium]